MHNGVRREGDYTKVRTKQKTKKQSKQMKREVTPNVRGFTGVRRKERGIDSNSQPVGSSKEACVKTNRPGRSV